jgi:hypothetical protein
VGKVEEDVEEERREKGKSRVGTVSKSPSKGRRAGEQDAPTNGGMEIVADEEERNEHDEKF